MCKKKGEKKPLWKGIQPPDKTTRRPFACAGDRRSLITQIGENMRKSNTLFIILVALSVIGILSIPALGQGRVTGTITGVITDPAGAVVQGAKVIATNKATSFKRETVTNSDGLYRLDLLPVGEYTVKAESTGFKQIMNNAVNLSVNDTLRVDFKLETGQVAEVVTVSDAPSIVNTETSTIGKVVDNRTLTD